MSNKILIIIIAGIIVVVGGFFIYKIKKSAEEGANNSLKQTEQNLNPKAQEESQNQADQSQPQAAACQRDFNQNTLKTAKVELKNRQVEINVKNFGTIQVEFYDQDAPKTVENFLRLANAGYYDCLTFHRVAKGFVIQGGDPTGTGSGGDSAFGKEFADELNPNTTSYKAGYTKGVLAMANRGANTNTSQFFIMLADTPLSHDYTIFGKVIAGQDVADKIGQVEITPQLGPTDGTPVTQVVMEKVTIIK